MRRFAALLAGLTLFAAAPPAGAQDLGETIANALAYSPSIEESRAGEEAAQARLERARAERNPQLRIEGSAGVGRIDNGGFFGFSADDTVPLSVQAAAEMPLFAGGRISSGVDQAGAGRDMARFQAERTRLEVTVQAVGAFAEVLTARKLEARFDKLVQALSETERQARLRFEAGEIASSDLAQARARRAEADAGLAQAQGRRISAEAAYLRLTGVPAGDLALPSDLPQVPASLDEALAMARTTNPVLLQARAAERAARSGVSTARAQAMPTVGAFAEAAAVRDQFFPDYRADSVAVGVRARWTLWSGGRNSADTRTAKAEAGAADARVRQADQAIEGMVIDAWQALNTARRTLESSRLQSEAAAEALRGRRLEAQAGSVTTLAVLDAEREAAQAEAALIEAQGMRVLAAWRLAALTGSNL